MGFHPGWKYETVIELFFRNGVLENAIDRSAKMAEIRQTILDQTRQNDSQGTIGDSEIHDFVERAFDLRYDM